MRYISSVKSICLLIGVIAVWGVLSVPRAHADTDQTPGDSCRLRQPVPIERLLRQTSFNIRGKPPTYEEYLAVEGEDDIPESMLDAFIADDAYRLQMRRFHESILWTTVESLQFGTTLIMLAPFTIAPGVEVWAVGSHISKAIAFRGAPNRICQNKPQSVLGWDASGVPNSEFMGVDGQGRDWYAEGWVEVEPYWAPNTTVKVCAFDAQDRLTFTHTEDGKSADYSCGTRSSAWVKECGCGPKLQWCVKEQVDNSVIASAMREQLLRLIDEHIDGSRPYSQILTTKRAHYNDHLLHYHKFLAPRVRTNVLVADHFPGDGVFPDIDGIDWNNPTWRVIERKGVHAGLLTLPAYTMRYQTNRGRANRFRITFTGQYFQPPDVLDYKNCDPTTPNLIERCMCRKCHQTLEPLAAHFGQVVEQGTAMLTGLPKMCKTEAECLLVGAPFGDGPRFIYPRLYTPVVSDFDEDHRVYRLRALEFASDEYPFIEDNFDAGPGVMAQKAIDSGVVARAMVQNLFVFFFNREMNLEVGAAGDESALLEELASEFYAHDDFTKLVKRIVRLPQYRRSP